MSEKVERALEIVRSFTEAEFHSFMEMLYISESSQSNVSFNDLIGKNRFKNGIVCPHCNSHSAVRNDKRNGLQNYKGVSTKHLNNYLVWYAWMQMNRELSEESLERNILNSSTSHNFRLLTSEISKKPVLPLAA